MVEKIDKAAVIAWIDGELDEARAAEVAAAVSRDGALASLAETHRKMKARFATAFGPIADEPVVLPTREPAAIISIAAARAEREARRKAAAAPANRRRWLVPGAIAASLIAGLVLLQPQMPMGKPAGIDDKANALALAQPIAKALDGQLSGSVGAVRVALSFRDRQGQYCRSFAATNISGIACRSGGDWQLRYASLSGAPSGEYRQAGDDAAQGEVVAAMIAGDPLDEAGERTARDGGWAPARAPAKAD